MIYTGTNSSLQKRAEEAIRYAIDYTLGEWGTLYQTRNGQPDLIVADISITKDTTPQVGQFLRIGEDRHEIISIAHSNTFPAGWRITTATGITATAGDQVRIHYGENVRRSDDMRSREAVPWLCFVQIINLKQDDPGSDYFSGVLVVSLHSLYNTITAEDGTAVSDASLLADIEPHDAKCSAIVNILNDPASLWQLVQPGAPNRPVSDLGIMAILNNEEPGSASLEGTHNFETRRVIRLIRTD